MVRGAAHRRPQGFWDRSGHGQVQTHSVRRDGQRPGWIHLRSLDSDRSRSITEGRDDHRLRDERIRHPQGPRLSHEGDHSRGGRSAAGQVAEQDHSQRQRERQPLAAARLQGLQQLH